MGHVDLKCEYGCGNGGKDGECGIKPLVMTMIMMLVEVVEVV